VLYLDQKILQLVVKLSATASLHGHMAVTGNLTAEDVRFKSSPVHV